ncbi:MAG: lytic transglycosylase domain-containing protein, partial [Runella sp.]
MKRTPLSLLVTFVFLVSSLLQAQVSIPTVPSSVGFAGINVQFDQDARAIIQADIKALLSNKKYWEAKLDRCLLFFPIVEGILIDENVPTDFKYLTVQESGLQPDAISASNAVGFWQFKKETGLEYGLRIDDQIDERKSINASTHAAAQYLKKSNAQYNNWVSSLYSYYLGAGGISKNIPAEWSYAKELKLNGKSDRYILRFFAHKIAIESAIDRYQSPNTTILLEYPQASGNNLKDIAAQFGIEPTLLRSQNRWLNGDEIPSDKDYTLVLPVDNQNLADAKAKLATIKRPNLRDNFAQKDIGFPV